MKPTDRVPSTAKPSKALKNSLGLDQEKIQSQTFHLEGIPLLISPQLLRLRDLGQLDLARLKKNRTGVWIVEIAEVKSSELGFMQMEKFQKARLLSSQHFLGSLFGFSTCLIQITRST